MLGHLKTLSWILIPAEVTGQLRIEVHHILQRWSEYSNKCVFHIHFQMRRPKKFVVIYLKIRWVCIARLLNRAIEAIHLKMLTSYGVSSRSSWSLSLLSSWSPFWWELQFCSSPWLGARFSRSIVPEEGRSEFKNCKMVICDSSGVLWIEKMLF